MSNVENNSLLLKYDELVSRSGIILMPNNIPLHLEVYNSDFAFTEGFVGEVTAKIPDSINDDIDTMNKINIPIVLNKDRFNLKDFKIDVSTEKRFVELARGGSNIAMDCRKGYRCFFDETDVFLDSKKVNEYSLGKGIRFIPRWYIHNLGDCGVNGELWFRNFAILFNNLGMEELGIR
jgi:hypothetical protein